MKKLINFLYILLISGLLSCEITPTVDAENEDLLLKTWIVESVKIDGFEDFVTDYSNFSLTFEGNNQVVLTTIYGERFDGTYEINNGDELLIDFSSTAEDRLYYIIEINEERLILLYQNDYIKETIANFEYSLIPAS